MFKDRSKRFEGHRSNKSEIKDTSLSTVTGIEIENAEGATFDTCKNGKPVFGTLHSNVNAGKLRGCASAFYFS